MDYTGYIVIGPKSCLPNATIIGINYTPTPEQIRNLQTMFGWDYVRANELYVEGEILK
jgi:hypothetical protein